MENNIYKAKDCSLTHESLLIQWVRKLKLKTNSVVFSQLKVLISAFNVFKKRSPSFGQRCFCAADWFQTSPKCVVVAVSILIHTYKNMPKYSATWFEKMRWAGQKFWGNIKFLFFLSFYSVNGKSVIKQVNWKLFLKILHTPFLSSALKYRITTHILPVFSYSESILTCHLILASYFSHVYLPVTCICYLKQKKKKKRKLTVALHYTILLLLWHFGILWSFISCIYFIRKYYALKIRK